MLIHPLLRAKSKLLLYKIEKIQLHKKGKEDRSAFCRNKKKRCTVNLVTNIWRLSFKVYRFNVIAKSDIQECWDLHQQHVPPEVLQEVADEDGPERDGGEDLLDWQRGRWTLEVEYNLKMIFTY